MNIDEMIANRNLLMEENRYQNDSTISRTMFGMGGINSAVDNMVINSTGKKTGLPFITAIQNGGFYQNNTFLGGNFVWGEGVFDKIPGFSWKNNVDTGFKTDFSIFGYKPQYYNAKSTEMAGVTDDFLKGIGGNKDFVIQSGLGFSKDYRGFFNTLKKQNVDVNLKSVSKYNKNISISGKEALENTGKTWNTVGSKIQNKDDLFLMKKILDGNIDQGIMTADDEVLKSVYKNIVPNANDVQIDNWISNVRQGNTDTKALANHINKNANIKEDVLNTIFGRNSKESYDFKNVNNGADIKNSVIKHIEDSKDVDIFELGENMKFGKKTNQLYESTDTSVKMAVKAKRGIATGDDLTHVLSSTEKIKIFDDYMTSLGTNVTNKTTTGGKIKTVNSWIKKYKGVVPDSKLGQTINSKIAQKTDDLSKGFLGKLKTSMIDDIGKEFFDLTGINKFFSNKYVKLATGNYVSGSVMIPLAITTGLISSGAVEHQEQSVNNFKDMYFFDNNPILNLFSDEASKTTYQHQQLSQSNAQDIQLIKSNRNIASRYVNDITPIEIDSKATSVSNFSII